MAYAYCRLSKNSVLGFLDCWRDSCANRNDSRNRNLVWGLVTMEFTLLHNGRELDVIVHNHSKGREMRNTGGCLGGYGDCEPPEPEELEFEAFDGDELVFNDTTATAYQVLAVKTKIEELGDMV